jgi:hypothetical protein
MSVSDIVAMSHTGLDGAFRFRTIVPKLYYGRTRHYHIKVQAPGSRLLTTQLYFPNEPANLRDGLFQRELLMRVVDTGDWSLRPVRFRAQYPLGRLHPRL